ncbi:unnamed protein product [Arabis nemorensis]|uniref:INO80 complex subunit B-like conserved region domain-containing protein n=1 Tax=Arabis nemorensis TaxID=586526 RepID=A0A565BN17_9BRAS|nr:unnamed protein product [Arabis nemorensis]
MEQQLKKAEAAQRRKARIEKAARESEAEAIEKILGQDSSRKKPEDKNLKRLDEFVGQVLGYAHDKPPPYRENVILFEMLKNHCRMR